MKKSPSAIQLLQDDREKDGWSEEYLGAGFKVENKRMKTGDYTIVGMEKILCIEKKSGWSEIACDIATKANRQRFVKMLRRMKKYPIKIMVIHDKITTLLGRQFFSSSIHPHVVLGWLLNFQLEYGITVLLVGKKSKAKATIRALIRKIVEYNQSGRLFERGKK